MTSSIDLNSDVGESFGAWNMGRDEALIPLVTSVNVACGFHAGDPSTIARTVELAARHGVAVGAHPGYPDLQGFGRRDLAMSEPDVEAMVLYQVAAVAGFCRSAGVPLRHVKPHGALYNRAATDPALAAAVARGVRRFSGDLVLVGLAGSRLPEAGRAEGLPVADEAFADRAYEPDGTLRSRGLPDAVFASPSQAVAQAVEIATTSCVTATDGSRVSVTAETLCLHGDTPGAPEFAAAVRAGLEAAGVAIRGLGGGG